MSVTLRLRRRRNVSGKFRGFAAAGLLLAFSFPFGHASAESVQQDSGGTIKYKIYPAQQLGKAFDHYDMTRDGIADLAYVNPSYQPGRFPIFDASNLPFMINNAKAGSGAIDDWYRKYAAAEMKDVKYCFAFAHDPGSFHSRTKKIM